MITFIQLIIPQSFTHPSSFVRSSTLNLTRKWSAPERSFFRFHFVPMLFWPSFPQSFSLLLAAPRPPAEESAGTNEGDEETDEEGDGVASSVPSMRRRDERSEDDQEERDENLQLHDIELCPHGFQFLTDSIWKEEEQKSGLLPPQKKWPEKFFCLFLPPSVDVITESEEEHPTPRLVRVSFFVWVWAFMAVDRREGVWLVVGRGEAGRLKATTTMRC